MDFTVESITREKVRNHNPLSNTKESFKMFCSHLHLQKGSLHAPMLHYSYGPQKSSHDQSKTGKKEGFAPENWEMKLGSYSSMLENNEKRVGERK